MFPDPISETKVIGLFARFERRLVRFLVGSSKVGSLRDQVVVTGER